MTSRLRLLVWILALLALGEGAALGFLALRSHWQSTAAGTAVQRGRQVAERMGCFGCHGPAGGAGIPNPGADEAVPSWSDGTGMMYNDKEEDVRTWILEGHAAGHLPEPEALLKMPAFKGRLADSELDDLVAYVLTLMQLNPPAGKAGEGREVAQRLGCFGCHGPEGRGLHGNPGSLKGYTPAWDGDDYADLVRGPDELRQWVRNGITDRFRQNPAARRFVEGEAVRMPAYGDKVSDADLAALQAYIEWVRSHPRGASPGRRS